MGKYSVNLEDGTVGEIVFRRYGYGSLEEGWYQLVIGGTPYGIVMKEKRGTWSACSNGMRMRRTALVYGFHSRNAAAAYIIQHIGLGAYWKHRQETEFEPFDQREAR